MEKLTNQDIMTVAMQQSAIDLHCNAQDFCKSENVIVNSAKDEKARRYLKLPFACDMVTYGSNIVASIQPQYYDIVHSYLSKYDAAHCFETPNMHILNEAFEKEGFRVCFMAEYFLPDVDILNALHLECPYETKILEQANFQDLYTNQWSNALCKDRRELDVLGVGAYENGNLIGLAACSADCDAMWQIGIDVLPEYRRKGIASALTNRLAAEIIKRDKVPFYCCAWCNIKSARNAVKSGFRPAWAELTVKPTAEVDEMNRR
ncbi:MAG: GNAT family N-acetyltransferase [Bacillus sp. (in: Bacteria)]|nr:GNAT family N-acetyltransferase [Bacillus sp. (in: firmicutes)]